MKISCLIISLKIPLTYGLIFGAWGLPQLGVSGAALGTLVSRAVGCIVGFYLLTSGRSRVQMRWSWRLSLNRDIIGRMMRIGGAGGNSGIFPQWCAYPVLSGGELDFAAHDCGRRADDWSADADDRHYAGAGFWRSGNRTGWSAIGRKANTAGGNAFGASTIRLCMVFIVVCAIIICAFAREIVDLFTDSVAVIDMGYVMLWFFTIAQVFSALSIVSAGILAGGGETRPPLYYTILAQWVVMLPLSCILAFLFGMDTLGIWIAWLIGGIIQGVLVLDVLSKGVDGKGR